MEKEIKKFYYKQNTDLKDVDLKPDSFDIIFKKNDVDKKNKKYVFKSRTKFIKFLWSKDKRKFH